MLSFDKERLLNDTLRDANYRAFREKAFRTGLTTLRRKNRNQIAPATWALAASIVLILSLTFLRLTRRVEPAPGADQNTIQAFVSVPLPPNELVHSSRAEDLFLETKQNNRNVDVVETFATSLPELDDRELLAFFGPRPAGLMRSGNKVELVILGN